MQVHRICLFVGHPPCFALWCFKVVHDGKKTWAANTKPSTLCDSILYCKNKSSPALFTARPKAFKKYFATITYIYKYLSEQIDTNTTCNQIEAQSYTEIASFNMFQCRQSQGHCLISMRAFHEDIPDLSHSPCEGQLRQWYAMRM